MGDYDENFKPNAHYRTISGVKTLVGIQPNVHRGDQQIDATAPHEIVGSALASIRGASTLSAFNTAMQSEWSNWPTYQIQFGGIAYFVLTNLPG